MSRAIGFFGKHSVPPMLVAAIRCVDFQLYITYNLYNEKGGSNQMDSIPISDARKQLSDLGNRVSLRGERIIIGRQGKGLFALVPLEDLDLLERLEDKMDIEAIRQRLDEPTQSLASLKKELGL